MLITCQQDCRFQVVRPIQELHPSASFGVLVVFRNAYTLQELAFALTDRSCAESSSRSSTPVVDWSLSQFRLRTLQGRSQRFFAYSMWKGKRGDYIQPCVSSTRSACYRSNIRGSDLSGELLTVLDDIVGGITKRLKMSLTLSPSMFLFLWTQLSTKCEAVPPALGQTA